MISRAKAPAALFLGIVLSSRFGVAQPELSPLQRPSRPMIEAAQQHYLTGTRFFEEGQWDASLVEFIASFQLSGERDLLFNISWPSHFRLNYKIHQSLVAMQEQQGGSRESCRH